MAMPDYDLGTRKLGNIGNIAQRTILWDEAGRHVQHAANASAGALLAADHYYLKQDEKSAHAALAECNGIVQNNWIEAQKLSWRDLEDAKTTPADKMNEIVRKAQQSDAYKRLNPRARRMFEESWKRKQIEYGQQAQLHAFNLARQKDADNTKTIAADIDNTVKGSYLLGDEAFAIASEGGAARQAAWMVRSSPLVKLSKDPSDPSFTYDDISIEGLDREDPQAIAIHKRIQETMNGAISAYVLDRAKTLADLAATAQPGTENFLKAAEETIDNYAVENDGKPILNEQQKLSMKAYIEHKRQTRTDVINKQEHDNREVFRNSITSQVQEILKNGSKGEETVDSLSNLSTALHQKTLPEAALFKGHEMEYDAILNYVDGRLHSEQNNYKANKKSAQDTLLQGGKDHFAAIEDRIRRMADEVHQGRKDGESADEFQTRQYLMMGMIGKYRQLDGYDVKFADEMEKLAATIANDQETEALVMIDQAFGVANDYNPQAKQSISQIKEMYKQVTAKNGDLYINGVEVSKMLDGTKGFNYWRMREQLRAAMNALPQGVDRIEAAKQWISQKKQTATAENAFTSMRSIAETLGITSKLEGDAEADAWFENAQKIISEYDKALKAISK